MDGFFFFSIRGSFWKHIYGAFKDDTSSHVDSITPCYTLYAHLEYPNMCYYDRYFGTEQGTRKTGRQNKVVVVRQISEGKTKRKKKRNDEREAVAKEPTQSHPLEKQEKDKQVNNRTHQNATPMFSHKTVTIPRPPPLTTQNSSNDSLLSPPQTP